MMKILKPTLVAACCVLASNSGIAANKIKLDVNVNAYIAMGLSASIDKTLIFGDIVKPNTGSVSMSVACGTGVLTYNGASGTPNGAAADSGAANSAHPFNNSEGPRAGQVTITGEKDYGISVSITVDNALSGLKFTPMLQEVGGASESDSLELVLASSKNNIPGTAQFNLCGELEVSSGTDTPLGDVDITANIEISYR